MSHSTFSSRHMIAFAVALLVANVAGPQYVYPTISTSLAARFHWSALENSLVSSATFIGLSFSGPVNARLMKRFGLPTTLRIATILGLTGIGLLAQTYAGRLPNHALLCALYFVCAGIAGAAAYMCVLESQSQNFKRRRGLSMGCASSALGLCGLVFSQINDLFFKSDDSTDRTYGFLLCWALLSSGCMLLGSFLLNVPQNIVEEEAGPLLSPIDHNKPPMEEDEDVGSCSGLAFFLHPAGIALVSILLVVLGLGYAYLANLGQILLSLPPPSSNATPQHVRNLHVSIFSLSNCASRALFGTLSDLLKHRYGVHRLWMFWGATAGFLLTLLYLVTGVTTAEALMPCTAMLAIVYGIVFGVAPVATAEFGAKVFVQNWGWLMCAPAVGSQVFNILFGVVYDHEAQRQGLSLCQGTICFRPTFTFGVVCTSFSLVVSTWAIVKLRLFHLPSPARSFS